MAHVLLVEDDPRLRLLLADFLAAVGHSVESACNGAEALERMRQDRPDAVVLDLQMPVVDGWAVLRTCRQTSALADLPVVVMSAMQDAGATVADLGVRCCLSKPFDLNQLAAALEDIERVQVQRCSYCRAERPARTVRVFTRKHPDGSWQLCDRCWMLLEVGFEVQWPAQDLEQRLSGPLPVHAAEARGWIVMGLARVGRRSAPPRPRLGEH